MAEKTGIKIITQNKKAWHDYFIDEKYEAGIELYGTEVKSIRGGGINLKGIETALAQKPQTGNARLARNTAIQVEWSTAEQPENGTQGVLVGLLMNGDEACCSEYIPEIKPEDESKAVTGNLFTDDGESAQEERDRKREEEIRRKREEAERKKKEIKEKQKGFLSGIMKRIKTLTDDFEDKVGEFLDDDNDKKG